MNMWIVEYETKVGRQLRRFTTSEKLWDWMQQVFNETGGYPENMLVFRAECVFDGGVV